VICIDWQHHAQICKLVPIDRVGFVVLLLKSNDTSGPVFCTLDIRFCLALLLSVNGDLQRKLTLNEGCEGFSDEFPYY
jgi:hypothetical protein